MAIAAVGGRRDAIFFALFIHRNNLHLRQRRRCLLDFLTFCGSKVELVVHNAAMRASRALHAGIVGINIGTIFASKHVVLTSRRLETPPANFKA